MWEVKTVIVGSSGVGKTCIAVRASGDTFNELGSVTMPGFQRVSVTLSDEITFNIWDTAGQESFRSLVPLYLRSAGVAIVVFDLTSQDSFDDIETWAKMILEANANCEFCLVGNKCDMVERRVVSFDDGLALSHEIGATFYIETSAKTGENVRRVFEQLAQSPSIKDVMVEVMSDSEDLATPEHVHLSRSGSGIIDSVRERVGEQCRC